MCICFKILKFASITCSKSEKGVFFFLFIHLYLYRGSNGIRLLDILKSGLELGFFFKHHMHSKFMWREI